MLCALPVSHTFHAATLTFPSAATRLHVFMLCHVRGFPTYKINMALFFSNRRVCGGAVVSSVAICFLKALSCPVLVFSPHQSPCLSLLALKPGWVSPVRREVGATDKTTPAWLHTTTGTGQSLGGAIKGSFIPFCYSASHQEKQTWNKKGSW